MRVYVCQREKAKEGDSLRGKKYVDSINYSTETVKQLVAANESVCLCSGSHLSLYLFCLIFFIPYQDDACACLSFPPSSLYPSPGPICSLGATSAVNISRRTSRPELWSEGANGRRLDSSIAGQQEGGHPGNYPRNVPVTSACERKRRRDFLGECRCF